VGIKDREEEEEEDEEEEEELEECVLRRCPAARVPRLPPSEKEGREETRE
jgi:hypothetical protein